MTKQEGWSEKPGFDVRTYIETRVLILFAIFNRRKSDELVEVFKNHLEKFSGKVLREVFDECESELEKFPAVKQVLIRCYEKRPSGAWRYNFIPTTDREGTPCLLDPDPACSDCNKLRSEHPHDKCQGWTNRTDNQFLYLPQNCPEGREFLKNLRTLAAKTDFPFVDLDLSWRNIQTQKVFLLNSATYKGENE